MQCKALKASSSGKILELWLEDVGGHVTGPSFRQACVVDCVGLSLSWFGVLGHCDTWPELWMPMWTIANIYFVEGTQTTIGSKES